MEPQLTLSYWSKRYQLFLMLTNSLEIIYIIQATGIIEKLTSKFWSENRRSPEHRVPPTRCCWRRRWPLGRPRLRLRRAAQWPTKLATTCSSRFESRLLRVPLRFSLRFLFSAATLKTERSQRSEIFSLAFLSAWKNRHLLKKNLSRKSFENECGDG